MSAPPTLPDDPWDWSVDQVVSEFCRPDQDRPAWCSPTDRLPNSIILEKEFRENEVTGEVLLTVINKQVLRDDLNIRPLGQRHAIEKGINYLRSRSQKFQQSPANVPMAPQFTPLQSWLQNSGPPYEYPSNIGGSVKSGILPHQPFESPRPDVQLDTFGGLHPNRLIAHASAPPLAIRASPVEAPRLETVGNAPVVSEPLIIANGNFAAPPQRSAAAKERKRIAPTFVAHLDDKPRYPAPSFGQERDAPSPNPSAEEESAEREFTILGAHVADGRRIFMSRRVKEILTLPRSNFPPDRHMPLELHVSDSKKGAKGMKLQNPVHELNKNSDLDYLLAKYPPKSDSEDVLALYGDSGDEGIYDDDTWHEIERDIAEDNSNRHSDRALPPSEVESTIEEAIEQFRKIWQDTRLAKVQAKGFRLWKKARREGRAQNEIATAKYWIQHLEKSVLKICQAIARETWSNAGAVRHQCQSLEESIFQQQEHRYNISILRKKTAPPRPGRKAVKRVSPKHVDLPEGEILLESESDLSTTNFIDDDDAEPIPSELFPAEPILSEPASASPDQVASEPISTGRLRTTTEDLTSVHTSEDSDEVLSPLALRRKMKVKNQRVDPRKMPFIESQTPSTADSDLDKPAPLPESIYEKVGHEKGMPIDLISSSEPTSPAKVDSSEDTRPPSGGEHLRLVTPTRLKLTKPKPQLNDIEGIMQMEWDLIEKDDHRRALAKAVYSLPVAKAVRIWAFVGAFAKSNLHLVLHQVFEAILNRHTEVDGISENDWDTARRTSLLFASYCLARKVLDERHLDRERIKKAQGLVSSGTPQFLETLNIIFSEYPRKPVLQPVKRKASEAASRQADQPISDSDSATVQQTPGKRKRRRVKQSQVAISSQLAGQRRVEENERRMASLNQKYRNIPGNMKDPASYAIGIEEPVIYLDPKIGGKVKPHQVDGIRFMWRELMTDENKQGCLLAHTMGLGKTMQVISLLVTIVQSVKSGNATIRRQIPHDLHNLKALILCPPSLIDNWFEEILMWRPDQQVLGELYKITQKLRLAERIHDIARWVLTGGILIISYDMFRSLIVNKGRNADERPLNDIDHGVVQDHLLNRPNIIIADEAHKMKNTEAGISMVTSRFKSTRRIALTGSPLANNLNEYFAMIDWIAPGYLGTKEQFRSKYAIPISNGLYNDSDMIDRRTSLRKLHVLKKNLDPKISRADITAIAGDLPSKTEFFITVPLTKLQIKAYNLYVTSLLGVEEEEEAKTTGNTRLWNWLAILSLLCNHPSTFLSKLDERQYGHQKKTKKAKNKANVSTDEIEGAGLPTDIEVTDAGISLELIEQQRKIFQSADDSGHLEDPGLSYRCEIVCEIIRLAVAAGDKVLLFSHSIPTLDYLEGTISSLGYEACRLDGSTKMTMRQDAVKEFNKETATYNVFLISTRAGGLGLNLQGANRVILFDYSFNPIWEEQAVGRAYRLGQQKPVFVYRLRAGGTFEELIYNKAVFKTQLSARVVDKKNPMRYASKKATDYLFRVKEVPQADLNDYKGKDPEVLDKVLSKSNCIRDITLTETFQREEDESLTPEEVKQANDELKDEQEKRRDPIGFERKRAELQFASLNNRPQTAPILSLGRVAAYPQQLGYRAAVPGSYQNQLPTILPTTTGHQPSHIPQQQQQQQQLLPMPPTPKNQQQMSYISRREAINGPQQTETAFWDQRAPPHLQTQLQNVLGTRPFHNTFPRVYPSPTAEQRPREASKPSESPAQSSKQPDGPTDVGEEQSSADDDQCKTQ